MAVKRGIQLMEIVGNIYMDKDKREEGRHLKVGYADDESTGFAYCVPCLPGGTHISNRYTRIRISGLLRRFKLVKEGEWKFQCGRCLMKYSFRPDECRECGSAYEYFI